MKKRCQKQLESIKDKLIWSSVIRPKMVTYFPVCIKIFILLKKDLDYRLLLSSIVDIAVILALPIISYLVTSKNHHDLNKNKFQTKYGSFYIGLKTQNKFLVSFQTPIFCLRRVFIGLSTIFIFQTSVGAIYSYTVSSMLMMAYNLH